MRVRGVRARSGQGMKRFLWAIGGCLFSLLLLSAVGVGVLYYNPRIREFPGGMSPGYPVADYDPRLTREASTAKVVIAALNRYRSQHPTFPAAASQLASYLPSASATPSG